MAYHVRALPEWFLHSHMISRGVWARLSVHLLSRWRERSFHPTNTQEFAVGVCVGVDLSLMHWLSLSLSSCLGCGQNTTRIKSVRKFTPNSAYLFTHSLCLCCKGLIWPFRAWNDKKKPCPYRTAVGLWVHLPQVTTGFP